MKLKIYIGTIIFSVLFIVLGNWFVSRNLDITQGIELTTLSGRVINILDIQREVFDLGPDFTIENINTYFELQITRGNMRGDVITAIKNQTSYMMPIDRSLAIGDNVIIHYNDFLSTWHFTNFTRLAPVIILGIILAALIIIVGSIKGLNALLSLFLVCAAIFFVLVPAILAGFNIYFVSIIICIFSVVTTLIIAIGVNKKATTAIIGSLGGLFLAGILIIIMDIILQLSGITDQESHQLLLLQTNSPINLNAIIFASILIGAVGAIMDVALSISSSLWEVQLANNYSFKELFKAGINIGQDMFSTMLNTLILAYIGSSLSVVLLISVNSVSIVELFNSEMIIIELLRALVGSFGIFLTVPLTTLICAYFYIKSPNNTTPN